MNFSVLVSVYRKDCPDYFKKALRSISIHQSLRPSEIILVVDGPVPDDLNTTIIALVHEIPYLTVIRLQENVGLGKALNIGMTHVSNELVARMDSDDISSPNRFELQVNFMLRHPEIAVCGGQISEFIGTPDNVVAYRNVPITPEGCRDYYRDRDPLNHMTVMLRKSAVMSVGNYQPWHLDEDTYLWGRLLEHGYKISNLPEILVNVRVGVEMYARRGGWRYFKSDIGILKWKLDHKLTGRGRFLYNYSIRFIVQVLMPNKIRGWVFRKLLRRNK